MGLFTCLELDACQNTLLSQGHVFFLSLRRNIVGNFACGGISNILFEVLGAFLGTFKLQRTSYKVALSKSLIHKDRVLDNILTPVNSLDKKSQPEYPEEVTVDMRC